MAKRSQSEMDIAAIKDSIKHSGEFRIHLIGARSGLRTTARMWHPDGFKVGQANGGGYDKQGAALGQAVGLFFAEELKGLDLSARDSEGNRTGYYGLAEYKGKRSIDGSCGIESVIEILKGLGFKSVRKFETGALSTMVLAEGLSR